MKSISGKTSLACETSPADGTNRNREQRTHATPVPNDLRVSFEDQSYHRAYEQRALLWANYVRSFLPQASGLEETKSTVFSRRISDDIDQVHDDYQLRMIFETLDQVLALLEEDDFIPNFD